MIHDDRDVVAGGPAYPYFSKIIEKGLRILNLFTAETQNLSLKDITLKTNINLASSFRIVETLIQLGYLKKHSKTKLITLGPAALILSRNISQSFDMLQIVQPFIDEAFEKYNITIDSSIVEKERLVSLYRREVKDTLVFKLPWLSDEIIHCTAQGKAYLAWLPDDVLSQVLSGLPLTRQTPHSLTIRAAVLADLRQTRERGYSINNQELVIGLISIGAPLINGSGTILGAVSFDGPTANFTLEEAEKRFVPAVLRLVQDIQPMLPV